jgi:energy-coupling factor transporter ATP-binding protein EcfA2
MIPRPDLLARLLGAPANAGALTLEQVALSFGGVHAIDDLDLEIRPGQVHGLIGPNGSGKTTTLNDRRAALTPPALEHPQRASVFAQFPAHCVSRVANPPYRLRQALLRDAELVSPVLYFVGLQEADAGPVRRSSLGGIVCHVCRAPFVGATATSSVRSACTEQRPGIEAQRQAVATYLNGGNWRIVAEFTEIESGKRSDPPAPDRHWPRRACVRSRWSWPRLTGLPALSPSCRACWRPALNVRFADLPMIEGAAGKFLLQQMAAVAELEAEMISARTKAALAAAKRRGVKLGGDRGARLTAERPCRSERAAGRWISPPPFRSYRRRAVSPCGPLLPVWRSAVSLRRGAGSGPLSRWLDCWRSPVALSAAQASAPCERQSRRAVTLSSPSFGLLARFSAAAPDRRRQKSWAVALTREMPRWQR